MGFLFFKTTGTCVIVEEQVDNVLKRELRGVGYGFVMKGGTNVRN
jgi:hypothetical protein